MNSLVGELRGLKIEVERFDFEYMAVSRAQGKKRPPPSAEKLVDEYRSVARKLEGRALFVGGKSLGGRVASLLACELPVKGVVAFGYPFHPPGRPEKLRTEHLAHLLCPMLICQGEKDPFGTLAEVRTLSLPPTLELNWLQDGNHELSPSKRSEATLEGNLKRAAEATRDFMARFA